MNLREVLLLFFIISLLSVKKIYSNDPIGIKEPKLKKGHSAFDEIEEFNEEVDLEHHHQLGMHIVEGDILEDDDSIFPTQVDNKQKETPIVGIPLKNNYHLEPNNADLGTGFGLSNILHSITEEIKKKQKKEEKGEKGEKRGVIRNELKLWRTRTIPYVVDPSREDVTIEIENGMREISSQTCLRFVKKTNEDNYLKFTKHVGCWSMIGQQGGEQIISIGSGCERKEVVAHEILHSLGFFHEQSRWDRDKNIKIFWNNIKPERLSQFGTATRESMDDQNLPYDLKSVLHYGNKAFSKNKLLSTIQSRKYPTLELGNTEGLSQGDVDEIKQLYKCDELPIGGFGKWNDLQCFDNLVRLKYRICYGQTDDVCEGHGVKDGLQVMRETCDRWQVKAYMEGCYNQKVTNRLPFQRRATHIACSAMQYNDDPSTTINEGYVRAYRICALMATFKKVKKFGITNHCYCWFGDDDVDLKENGKSKACKDGTGFRQAIFLYIIEYRDEDKI